MPQISNEDELRPMLRKFATWKTLFLWEAGVLTIDEAARQLGLTANDADWLRVVALDTERAALAT